MAGKFTRKPGSQATPNVADFIGGAERRGQASSHTVSNDTEPYSWENPRVREDVQKAYNLRLPEPYLLKLKYIAEHTPDSMHKFCLNVLLPAIDERIEELTDRKSTRLNSSH